MIRDLVFESVPKILALYIDYAIIVTENISFVDALKALLTPINVCS
jgi:hypothetical protein